MRRPTPNVPIAVCTPSTCVSPARDTNAVNGTTNRPHTPYYVCRLSSKALSSPLITAER